MSLWSCAVGLRTCIRRCSREKDGTVGSECDDHAAEDGFTVVKHSTDCVDDPGNEALKLLPLRDHNAGGIAPVVTMTLTASHFNSNAQRSPAGGCPSVASIGGTGFPVAALMPSTVCGLVQVCSPAPAEGQPRTVLTTDGQWAYRHKDDAGLITMKMTEHPAQA